VLDEELCDIGVRILEAHLNANSLLLSASKASSKGNSSDTNTTITSNETKLEGVKKKKKKEEEEDTNTKVGDAVDDDGEKAEEYSMIDDKTRLDNDNLNNFEDDVRPSTAATVEAEEVEDFDDEDEDVIELDADGNEIPRIVDKEFDDDIVGHVKDEAIVRLSEEAELIKADYAGLASLAYLYLQIYIHIYYIFNSLPLSLSFSTFRALYKINLLSHV
jgi:hypothetical protein